MANTFTKQYPNSFSATQQTHEVLKNTDNETQKIYDVLNALNGTQIANAPAGNISATTVQAAINELEAEKSPRDNPVFTGTAKGDVFCATNPDDATSTIVMAITNTKDGYIGTQNKPLSFWTNGNKRVAISPIGDVEIKNSGSLYLYNGMLSSASDDLPLQFGINGVGRAMITTTGMFQPTTDNAYTNGSSSCRWSQIWSATATINTSDERHKNSIANSMLGLGFINALRPVSYKFNIGQNIVTQEPNGEKIIEMPPPVIDDNGTEVIPAVTEPTIGYKQVVTPLPGKRNHYGLIAQEVKAILGDTDFGGFIYDKDTDSYGLRYEEFIAPLIKAVQELYQEVQELKAKVGA